MGLAAKIAGYGAPGPPGPLAFFPQLEAPMTLNPQAPARTAPAPAAADGSPARPIVRFETVRENPRIKTLVRHSDECLAHIGYTEHGERHVGLVAHIAMNVLKRLGHPERDVELAGIAGYMHDIGNGVNREGHAQIGAVMAMQLLIEMGMPDAEMAKVIAAIGNHHEIDGDPVNVVAAAVMLADKSDVHRTRVRNPDFIKFDIHDRVNYAVEKSFLNVDESHKSITLELTTDSAISQVMEYFEIFMTRMLACRKAAMFLGCTFGLSVNGNRLT